MWLEDKDRAWHNLAMAHRIVPRKVTNPRSMPGTGLVESYEIIAIYPGGDRSILFSTPDADKAMEALEVISEAIFGKLTISLRLWQEAQADADAQQMIEELDGTSITPTTQEGFIEPEDLALVEPEPVVDENEPVADPPSSEEATDRLSSRRSERAKRRQERLDATP